MQCIGQTYKITLTMVSVVDVDVDVDADVDVDVDVDVRQPVNTIFCGRATPPLGVAVNEVITVASISNSY